MIYALKSFLETNGYRNVCVDFMPDEKLVPEVIYLGLWEHDLGQLHDGTSARYVQIQVRRPTAEAAQNTCNSLVALLDSGTEENIINLTPSMWCIARPTQGAKILARGATTTTYYANVTLWGET